MVHIPLHDLWIYIIKYINILIRRVVCLLLFESVLLQVTVEQVQKNQFPPQSRTLVRQTEVSDSRINDVYDVSRKFNNFIYPSLVYPDNLSGQPWVYTKQTNKRN